MIGMSVRSTPTRFCSSRPLRSGRTTSSTRQLGAETLGLERKSCADAKVSVCQPAESISDSSDRRTDASSSTTNTIGVACDIGDHLQYIAGCVCCTHFGRVDVTAAQYVCLQCACMDRANAPY